MVKPIDSPVAKPLPDQVPDSAVQLGVAQPRPGRRIQMADIARMAGVSNATVSRALSGSPLIPQETRDRIAELARSLNYRVNASAANLRKQAVSTVGVVMLSSAERPAQAVADPFVMTMVASLADELAERGQDMLLARCDPDRLHQLPDLVRTGRVAGLVVMGQWVAHDALNAMARQGLPMVVWGASVPGTVYPVVGSDNEQGGCLATRHLLAQGCRRIAFLGRLDHPESAQRHQGYLRALQEAGVQADPAWQHPVAFSQPSSQAVVDQWVATQALPDGVFACSDLVAMGVVSALAARGLSVPGDVKLVGFDDVALAAHVHPSLTTVRQDMALAARTLMEVLGRQVQGLPDAVALLPTTLVVRHSSGAVD